MGMGFAPTWLRQVSPLLHKTTLTTVRRGPKVRNGDPVPLTLTFWTQNQ